MIKCDLCNDNAIYDVRLPLHGAWCNVCELCFKINGCSLGTGQGQRLNDLKDTGNDTGNDHNTDTIQCVYCSDNCGSRICYGCKDTLELYA